MPRQSQRERERERILQGHAATCSNGPGGEGGMGEKGGLAQERSHLVDVDDHAARHLSLEDALGVPGHLA